MVKGYIRCALALLFCASVSYAGTLADQLVGMSGGENNTKVVDKNMQAKSISIIPTLLSDSAGLKYVGGVVDVSQLTPYLTQLKVLLKDEFDLYRQGQILRDHGKFHITLINPFELKDVDNKKVGQLLAGQQNIQFELKGLGRVANEQGGAYFVIATSSIAQALRTNLALKEKDFHVTLGFSPKDIHGVRKDSSTLID